MLVINMSDFAAARLFQHKYYIITDHAIMSVCVIVVVVVGGGGSSSSSSQAEKHIRRHYHVICYYVELC